jgi:integrase
MFKENPAENLKSINPAPPKRELLTLEELQSLAETPFDFEDLRRASLFAALTDLRYSDVEKITWSEIQSAGDDQYVIRFRQKKTGENETLSLSGVAVSLLGKRAGDSERIFKDLNYSQTKYVPDWTKKAGITQRLTIHAFRHTFATLQLTFGTDIYTGFPNCLDIRICKPRRSTRG